jgi:rubrerythrin
MPNFFQASELLSASIRIEKNGEAFYREIGRKLKEPKIVELFEFLAVEELRHVGVFSEMLQKIGAYEPDRESYPGEYHAYLKTFSDNHIFNRDNIGLALADKMHSPDEILNFAIRIELEFMFFYMGVQHYLDSPQSEVIVQLIKEERDHYFKLFQMQNGLMSS